jgi:dGTPase
VVQSLFRAYLDDPSLLPPTGDPDPVTRATDFVSGMTDRYALRAHRDMFIPHDGPL